ncbi:hypothetical protein [Flexithrix dorotheae]|uniref:hypothetical protein n=1 Tax=Flexithrix dorotheae TaxID=70993 RepID=UPI00037455C6|nr:hypothetical protein [Flexithrix dorotheae]
MVIKNNFLLQIFNYFLFLLTITSCQTDKLQGSWFAVDVDRPMDYCGAYATIYSFKDDSLIIDYGGWENESHFIKSAKGGIIQTNSLPDIPFQFIKDTLILEFDSTFHKNFKSDSEKSIIKLLSFQPAPISESIKEVAEMLKNHYWTLKAEHDPFGNQTLGVVFLDENRDFPNAKKCVVEHFGDNFFMNTAKNEMYFWMLGEVKGQPVLLLDKAFRSFYPSEFFITKIQNDTIWANAWKRGDKYEVLLISSPLIDKIELERKRNELIGKWLLESVEIPEFKVDSIDREVIPDSMIIAFEEVGIDEELMEFVIKEEDWKNKLITYEFNEDSSFQVKRGGEVIQEGGWKLNRSGKTVNMNIFPQGVSKKFDYKKTGLTHDFLIRDFKLNALSTEQNIYIYENEKLAPKFYKYLHFSKTPDS